MPRLNRHDLLRLHRADPQQPAFGKSLFPPLARSIMAAVSLEVSPVITLMRAGGTLVLDYANTPVKLTAQPDPERLHIRLHWDNGNARSRATVYTWAAFQGHQEDLVIVGFDGHNAATPTDGARTRRLSNFTLRPEIASGLPLSAAGDFPEVVAHIAWAVQGFLTGDHLRQPPAQPTRPVPRAAPQPREPRTLTGRVLRPMPRWLRE